MDIKVGTIEAKIEKTGVSVTIEPKVGIEVTTVITNEQADQLARWLIRYTEVD